MNARYRWLKLDPLGRGQVAKIATAMQAKPYIRDVTSGYSLTTVRSDCIEGTFTERLEYVEKILDPLGGELSVQRVEFRRTDFRIGTTYPHVELKNPARQVKPLLNLIAETLDFQVAVCAIEVSPLEWVKQLAKLGEPVQVFRIRSGQFALSNEAQASVIVTGTSDVRSTLPALLGKRVIEAESVVCGWRSPAGEWRVELRSSGCANVVSAPLDNPAQVFRKALVVLSEK